MDAECFDALARSLTINRSRRGTLAAALGGLVSLLGLGESLAGKRKKRKKKKRKKDLKCQGKACGYRSLEERCALLGMKVCGNDCSPCCPTCAGGTVCCDGQQCCSGGQNCVEGKCRPEGDCGTWSTCGATCCNSAKGYHCCQGGGVDFCCESYRDCNPTGGCTP